MNIVGLFAVVINFMVPFSVRAGSYFPFLPAELSYFMLCKLCISQCYYGNHNH